VEEIRALGLGFCKEDVVGKEEHARRSWINVSFLCWLDLVETKYWEYNCKPFKENNWKSFIDVVNASFSNDVRWNWGCMHSKVVHYW
jgi:hypothetical protein